MWPSTAEGIHEFAWGKSKDADDSFTFSVSPTPTPTVGNIYIEYIKKKFSKTNEQAVKKDKGVSNQNEPVYEKPQHYIEKITQQKKKKKTTQTHTVIKKTHITIDEVEQHSGAGNKSDSFEKHIELDQSETDIEGQNRYDTDNSA